jgi:hypothetical protein
MSTPDLNCRLLCASASSYAITTTDISGQYNPITNNPNGGQYATQYNAVGFTADPYIVVSAEIEAAMVGKTDTELIIAFRGTLPPVPFTWDGFFDWMQDFWATPTTNINLPGEVHSGFLLALIGLADGIKDAVNSLDPNGTLPIYITGHSKGGGMAPIAAMYFKNLFGMNISQTVTFAGPKPGNGDFCNTYNSEFPNDLRYENYLDMVPLLPPSDDFIELLEDLPLPSVIKNLLNDAASWDYEAVGTLKYINAEGNVALIPTPMAVRIADIVDKLATDPIEVADAHHASCGFRYMQGTCMGTVCPS